SWHKSDYGPLAGKKIVSWGDADEPGWAASQALSHMLADPNGLACSVKLVDTNRMPDGWDVRDALAEGWNFERLIAWLRERARPVAHPVSLTTTPEQGINGKENTANPASPAPGTPMDTPPEPAPAAPLADHTAAQEPDGVPTS